jgi:hypothetical protein
LEPILIKKILLLTIFTLTSLVSPFGAQVHQASAQSDPIINEGAANKALCLPNDINNPVAADCLLSGPASRLNELSKIGITFPAEPLPVLTPPTDLSISPFRYAQVKDGAQPLYATIDDASANTPTNKLEAGRIRYVSWLQKVTIERGVFYQTATEEWISADSIKKVGIQNFQGFEFKENPTVNFGWILTECTSRKAPGYAAAETGKQYWRTNVVRVFDSETVKGIEWVMIGPDEWIEHRFIGRVIPNYTKPAGVESDRWIEINLYEQVLSVYENNRILFATLISTGVDPFFTQPGVFQIYKKLVNDPMSGTFETDRSDYYYLEDVPFILYYDKSRALHGAYWNTLFGYQRSHGCVNLSVADSHYLFDWANVGDYVYVWDPSGKTPTDPSVYGAGGF